MYQLMVEYTDEFGDSYMVRSGRLGLKLKILKRRLSKFNKGWIVDMNSKAVVYSRGFSKQAMRMVG